jgi:hypothetical protein
MDAGSWVHVQSGDILDRTSNKYFTAWADGLIRGREVSFQQIDASQFDVAQVIVLRCMRWCRPWMAKPDASTQEHR